MKGASAGIFGIVPLAFLRAGYAKRAIAVYTALSSFQGKAQDCFPSLTQIALRSGLTKTTVSKAIGLLVKDGWLQSKRRGRSSNLYSLAAQKGEWAKLPIGLLRGDTSKRDLLVYGSLSSFQGAKDHCFPSRRQIAERSGIRDLGSISKSISKLRQAGWIESRQRSRESNLYVVNNLCASPLPFTSQGQESPGLPFLPQKSMEIGAKPQWQSEQAKAVSQCQNGQLEASPQCQNGQLEASPQWPSEQLKAVSQCQNGQLEASPRCQNGHVHGAVLSGSFKNKTTKKTSSIVSGSTYRTLGSHSARMDNSKGVHSASLDNSRQTYNQRVRLKKTKIEEEKNKKMENQNNRKLIPKTQNETSPKSIHLELTRYFRGNVPKETIIIRQLLFNKVLPSIFREVKAQIEEAIFKEEDGRLYMQDSFPFKKEILEYMGCWVKFESSTYNPEDKSISEYLEENLYKKMPTISKERIKQAIVKEQEGILYVDKLKIMPHHAVLLLKMLGRHICFVDAS